MSDAPRPKFLEFFVKSKTGRMILFTVGLGLLCFLVPYACGRKPKVDSVLASDAAGKGEKDVRYGDLPPSPVGIGETLTLGQKYDALISRHRADLATTKSEADSTRKEREPLRPGRQHERGT